MKEFVLSLNKKTTKKHWISYFQIATQVQQSFIINPLNIIFGDLGIWLLGYRIELSFLYIPQGYYFISTLRL